MNKLINGTEFINDENAIGKWEYFDCINSIDEFEVDSKHKARTEDNFKEIYFMPNGQKYWIFEGWTKGMLFIHYGGDDPVLCYKYVIKDINNNSYMFITVQNENDMHIEVLKKVSNKAYQLMEIGNRENVDLEFIYDEKIVGTWIPVAFVSEPNYFDDTKTYDNIWLKYVCFKKDGTVERNYFDKILNDTWTKGFLIDKEKSILSKYEIKTINNIEYLFLEWKMGNYVYGDAKADYYVLKRK